MTPLPEGGRPVPSGAVWVGLAVAVYAASLLAGGANLLTLVLPLFTTLGVLRYGVRGAALLFAVFLLTAWVTGRGTVEGLVELLLLALGVAVLVVYGWGWLSLPRAMGWASALQLAALGAVSLVVWLASGVSPTAQLLRGVDAFLGVVVARLAEEGGGVVQMEELLGAVRQGVARIYPALLFVNLAVVNLVNLQLLRPLWVATGQLPASPPFPRAWRLPDHLGWGVVGGVVGLRTGIGPLQVVAANLLVLLLFLFTLQGFGLLSHLLHRARVPALLRGLLYALLLVSIQLYPILAVAGLVEGWLDVRRLRPGRGDAAGG
ncbi:MAG: hypothetical protein COW73_11205 [Nitrospirae bacterium CG18_big_fil_WC_8_21_14_2_50_70_55]|nr:DUF2232 domain-containing protein [Deltaproteobacteria bacterium]PIQ03395.1 MAG: hypothetical protein COW73_11205 [Nitrospirae bacterium CG18_big_fil_WC_8_21_14_2_50_70_55]PIU79695.1 MAG: hypothetical protein COS73_03230 [Nitrospirae bacterium CG06_land_8_20_14_3_00_70_43]PIW82023.1 MAG: hypothetical protein COZ96_10945 [Nitrospirae bacterium CG_4_8_14_3_um_filter_70_85]PIX83897.1 MAG: hypothetical protein COZ33_02990 [Nitrospirae bacterium CG_4_10_14_3_um_filter_70_108]PJB97105.1 MAG: hypo